MCVVRVINWICTGWLQRHLLETKPLMGIGWDQFAFEKFATQTQLQLSLIPAEVLASHPLSTQIVCEYFSCYSMQHKYPKNFVLPKLLIWILYPEWISNSTVSWILHWVCTPALLGPAGRVACRIAAEGTQPKLIVLQCVIAKWFLALFGVLSAATHNHFLATFWL